MNAGGPSSDERADAAGADLSADARGTCAVGHSSAGGYGRLMPACCASWPMFSRVGAWTPALPAAPSPSAPGPAATTDESMPGPQMAAAPELARPQDIDIES
ncbi:MAG: hypothetical protein QM674_21230 [Burkholderiaceae bacterium]